jgi:hypothetical protein
VTVTHVKCQPIRADPPLGRYCQRATDDCHNDDDDNDGGGPSSRPTIATGEDGGFTRPCCATESSKIRTWEGVPVLARPTPTYIRVGAAFCCGQPGAHTLDGVGRVRFCVLPRHGSSPFPPPSTEITVILGPASHCQCCASESHTPNPPSQPPRHLDKWWRFRQFTLNITVNVSVFFHWDSR